MKMTNPDIFLGLDASSQSLGGTLVTEDGSIVPLESFNYVNLQPKGFGLNELGFWESTQEDGSVVAYGPPVLYANIFDLFMRQDSLAEVAPYLTAISGAGQQHGHIPLASANVLDNIVLGDQTPIGDQLLNNGAFTRMVDIKGTPRPVAATWRDSSTSAELNEMIDTLGGLQATIETYGGVAERFLGPQIKRFDVLDPQGYQASGALPFISAFHYMLVSGQFQTEQGDGLGSVLMSLATSEWDPRALDATAPDLLRRLPTVVDPTTVTQISNLLIQRYSTNKGCYANPHTGDNPSSLIGMGAVEAGKVVISLGTSDTAFGHTGKKAIADLLKEFVAFGAPTAKDDRMYLGCWKTGDGARRKVAFEQCDFNDGNWDAVSHYLKTTAPDPKKIGFYGFDPEIVPKLGKAIVQRSDDFAENDIYNVKAVIEARAMAIKSRLDRLGVDYSNGIELTGGASQNDGICQVYADVFGVEVRRIADIEGGTVALGAAIRARHAYHNQVLKDGMTWKDAISPYIKTEVAATPNELNHAVYKDVMMGRYQAMEQKCIQKAA